MFGELSYSKRDCKGVLFEYADIQRCYYSRNSQSVGAPGGRCWSSGAQVVFMEDIFILNEIWAQDKNIYFGRHFACLKYEACYIL
jgi:hypothetical protein